MNGLKNYNGRYCESDYENAFISFLEAEGWQYLAGNNMTRSSMREVLYVDDLEQFLSKTNGDLAADEVRQILDTVRLAGADSDFATLHKVYGWMVDGIQFTPKSGNARMVKLIDFDSQDPTKNNIFRVVNQFTVEYTNNGQVENRRPDVILYVNGLPLCVVELKNPADAHATILDAWEQINVPRMSISTPGVASTTMTRSPLCRLKKRRLWSRGCTAPSVSLRYSGTTSTFRIASTTATKWRSSAGIRSSSPPVYSVRAL